MNETPWRIKSIMVETLFISNLTCEIKDFFRRIEQINIKLINCRSSILFKNTCLKVVNSVNVVFEPKI